MRIEIITAVFNEEKLLPFFFKHYDFADEINVLYDEDSTDGTLNLCKANKKVNILPFRFPDGMNDVLKIEHINKFAQDITDGWIIAVDADEFVFALPLQKKLRGILEKESCNIVMANLWQVYRHKSESDIDIKKPVVQQRRYGEADMTKGLNSYYIKPCIIRAGVGLQWTPGCHRLKENTQAIISGEKIYGTHWAMADVDIAIQRRIYGRKLRQSKYNLENRLSFHNHNITAEQIAKECLAHEQDSRLF